MRCPSRAGAGTDLCGHVGFRVDKQDLKPMLGQCVGQQPAAWVVMTPVFSMGSGLSRAPGC